MVAFFFGSLSVFDREIDRWSLPDTRIEPQPMPSFDAILATRFATITEPDAVTDSSLPDDTIYGDITIDPRDGRVLPEDRLALGSTFFYPMHYSLHVTWHDLGYWIVGFAAMMMLVALVSGVVMHRKIFRDFFTFRPGKR